MTLNQTSKFQEVDSLVKCKLLVPGVVEKYKHVLRKVFKSENLATFCVESSKNGFLSLYKLCFGVLDMGPDEINRIIQKFVDQ